MSEFDIKESKIDEREERIRKITLLVQAYYDAFEFLHRYPVDNLISRALDMYLDTDLTIDQVNEEIAKIVMKMKNDASRYTDEDSIKQNHKKTYSKLEEFVKLLNAEGVDYQLAGALCGYIKYGEESKRYHEDIDISINEKDIPKLKRICEKMGLKFSDNRFNSPRILKNGIPSGEHEIIATEDNSDFHIGAFAFERLADGTIINKGYYHDSNNNPCCREETISSELASLIYEKEPIDFRGVPLYITSPEYIYMIKNYTRKEKDMQDVEFLDDKIDKDKLNKIKELSKTERFTQNTLVTKKPEVKEDNPELQDMLYTTTDLEKDMKRVKDPEVTKQLKKIDARKAKIGKENKGSISIVSIILALLVVFAIILVGLIFFTVMR